MGFNPTKGNKQNWNKPVDAGEYYVDLLGLTAVQAAELQDVEAWTVVDINGVHRTVYRATHIASSIDPTDFAKMGVGSRIYAIGLTTPAIYVKVASSATPDIGDWYLEELTQAS
jgi:hypothetical protein